jgi:hypothetical protein
MVLVIRFLIVYDGLSNNDMNLIAVLEVVSLGIVNVNNHGIVLKDPISGLVDRVKDLWDT